MQHSLVHSPAYCVSAGVHVYFSKSRCFVTRCAWAVLVLMPWLPYAVLLPFGFCCLHRSCCCCSWHRLYPGVYCCSVVLYRCYTNLTCLQQVGWPTLSHFTSLPTLGHFTSLPADAMSFYCPAPFFAYNGFCIDHGQARCTADRAP